VTHPSRCRWPCSARATCCATRSGSTTRWPARTWPTASTWSTSTLAHGPGRPCAPRCRSALPTSPSRSSSTASPVARTHGAKACTWPRATATGAASAPGRRRWTASSRAWAIAWRSRTICPSGASSPRLFRGIRTRSFWASLSRWTGPQGARTTSHSATAPGVLWGRSRSRRGRMIARCTC